jgi:hypothetical protein
MQVMNQRSVSSRSREQALRGGDLTSRLTRTEDGEDNDENGPIDDEYPPPGKKWRRKEDDRALRRWRVRPPCHVWRSPAQFFLGIVLGDERDRGGYVHPWRIEEKGREVEE